MFEGYYDYRSDTITHPTDEMWEAMRKARLGDDGRGDDPTVQALEAESARLLGKEAAVFVTSGTQGNLVSLLAHERRGGEVLVEASAHIYRMEAGGLATIAGMVPRPVPGVYGRFTPEQVAACVRPDRPYHAPLAIVCIENTHNDAGGTVWSAAETAAVAEAAHRAGAVVHLDGARIFNAAVALGVPAAELAAPVDSVTFCLSKGLSAPAGSIVAGSRAFIARARRARQILGGTLRQAGVLAAAGLVALAHYKRLREDHATARALAEGLAAIPGVRIDLEAVQTNIVYADVRGTGRPAPALVEALAAERVRALPVGADRIRFVTHRHVEPGDIGPTLAAVRRAVTGAAA